MPNISGHAASSLTEAGVSDEILYNTTAPGDQQRQQHSSSYLRHKDRLSLQEKKPRLLHLTNKRRPNEGCRTSHILTSGQNRVELWEGYTKKITEVFQFLFTFSTPILCLRKMSDSFWTQALLRCTGGSSRTYGPRLRHEGPVKDMVQSTPRDCVPRSRGPEAVQAPGHWGPGHWGPGHQGPRARCGSSSPGRGKVMEMVLDLSEPSRELPASSPVPTALSLEV